MRRWLRRYLAMGAVGASPRRRRRIRALNTLAVATPFLSFSYIPIYLYHDAAGLYPVVLAILFTIPILFLTPLTHRYAQDFGIWMYLLVGGGSVFLVCWLLGRESGLQVYFAVAPAAALTSVGVRRIPVSMALAVAALGLIMVVETYFRAPAPFVRADSMILAYVRYSSYVGLFALVYLIVYHALRVANRAEDALEKEYRRSERLLSNMLPAPVAHRLKEAPRAGIADNIDAATVLFADIVGFSDRASRMRAAELVRGLNQLFTAFDEIAARHRLEKIKTIGDAYMVVGGAPEPRADHAQAIAAMALDMMACLDQVAAVLGWRCELRIGVHSGPMVAGVIGVRKLAYDVWGDTVNLASRMASNGAPGEIFVTDAAQRLMAPAFDFESRGVVEVKGRGKVRAWALKGVAEGGAAPPPA